MARRSLPRKVNVFRAGPAAPRAQHHHRVDVRGRPPLPLHDARRSWPARAWRGDPAGTGRMAAGMPERLDEEELADWRAGRNAVYLLAALTVGACLAVADA
jgi:hypothetical protein